MTPAESREATMSLSRERLARALTKFERLAHDASETIANLRQEKQGLESRLVDLTRLFEQERSNFEQREALLTSVHSESEERLKAFDLLTRRLDAQERLMNEQLSMISTLESDLADRAGQLHERIELESGWKEEIEEWRSKVGNLEARVEKAEHERDSMKSQMYELEREEAQFALRLTPEERDIAAKSVDSLLDRLTEIESRINSSVSEQ